MKLFRNQAAVLITLFDNDMPVNANVIASLINTSLKTVKKEIDDLNFICLENGCEIVSYPGSGYKIEVSNTGLYDGFVDEVKSMYNRNLFYHDAQDERISYIVRLFLVYRNLSINELMDFCFCSESSIRRDFKLVRAYLDKFNLALVNQTNRGISLIGDEWHIRMAMLHTRFEYRFKNKVIIDAPEERFEDLFFDNTEYKHSVRDVVEEKLNNYDYKLSFDSLMRFSVMVALSITRNANSVYLNVSDEMKQVNIDVEKEIVNDIYKYFTYHYKLVLTKEDEVYLSIFLKSVRLIRYREMNILSEKEKIEKIANGFLSVLRKKFDIMDADTTVLFRDLCSMTYNLMYSSMLDSHFFKSIVNQQLRDGLFNLDLCAIFYEYLTKDCGFNVLPEDVAYFYHAFVSFSSINAELSAKKILVIAEGGFFTARSMATLINARNTNFYVNYIPMEFGEMRTINTDGIDGIVTDISAIKRSVHNIPVVSLSFFRDSKNVNRMSRQFVFNEQETRAFFKPDDIYYADDIEDEEGIYRYIRENVLNDDPENDEKFLEDAKKLRSVYSRTRNNNIYLVNSLSDYYGKDFLKVICLNETIRVDNYLINKILVFNFKSDNFFHRNFLSTYIGYLIHNRNTFISNDRERDYERLISILSE